MHFQSSVWRTALSKLEQSGVKSLTEFFDLERMGTESFTATDHERTLILALSVVAVIG